MLKRRLRKAFSKLAEDYRRWRHTRGYGVHSPFSFRMVTRVIRPPRSVRYYPEMNLLHLDRKNRNLACFIVRLAAELDIRSAVVTAPLSFPADEVLRMVRSDIAVSTSLNMADVPELIISQGQVPDLSLLMQCLRNPRLKALLILDYHSGWEQCLFENMREGILLRGRSNALLVTHKDMQKVDYSVRL